MRKYQRKTERKICTPEMLEIARKRLKRGDSNRGIAKDLGITESALRQRLKKGFGVEKLGRFTATFTKQQEVELAGHCKDMDTSFYGLTFKDLRRLAFEYAESNGIDHKFNKDSKTAGKDWALNFMKKYHLCLRTPQQTSLARIMGFNKVQLNVFFSNLSDLMMIHKFTSDNIYNMDETGLSTVPNHVPKVISATGKKAVGKISSAERGQLVTAICAISAAGQYVPPALIFKRKRTKPELMNGAPPASVMLISDSGYVNTDLFLVWIKHFQKYIKATKDNPALLILDNHSSHLSLEAIIFCRDNGIHMLSIPPHSSHKVQPLDRCFFKALKTYYAEACNNWLVSNPGRVITQFQIAELFGKAYCRSATVEKAVKAFKICGIVPIDPGIFTDDDFAPCAVTDMQQLDKETPIPSEADLEVNHRIPLYGGVDVVPSTSGSATKEANAPSTSGIQQTENSPSGETRNNALATSKPPPLKPVSPAQIRPLPKRKDAQQRRRKGQKSEIITSSPFKNNLQTSRAVGSQFKRKMTSTDTQAKPKKNIKNKVLKRAAICPGCEEEYEDPPTEDWIECKNCKEWWHEACSSYEGKGEFYCDNC